MDNKKLINKMKRLRRKHGRLQKAALSEGREYLSGYHGGMWNGAHIAIKLMEGKEI
jgi:hypothetical protein